MKNLGELVLESCQRHADRVAFRVRRGFRTTSVTFAQCEQKARQLAAWFAERGLVPGDRVLVWAPNMPEYPILYFGSWLAGIVVVPVDVRTKGDVVERLAAASRPRICFVSRMLRGQASPQLDPTLDLEDLFTLIGELQPRRDLPQVERDDLAQIAYTSGTTGAPKGVMLTHGNLLAETEALRVAFPLKPSDRVLSVLPLSHALELTITLLHGFSSGVPVTYVPRVNSATIGRALRDDRITCFVLVPQLLSLILAGIQRRVEQAGRQRQWRLAHRVAGHVPQWGRRLLFRQVHQALGGHLRFFGCGGAPLDSRLAATWERMGIPVFEGYGLTETAAASALNTWQHRRLGTVGRPLPSVQIRIGAEDEIQIRGQTVSPGYFEAPELTARAFDDGWFRTADVGSFDADGFLRVSARQAFKIVLADGRNVYPEDVERALNQHELVQDSIVLGVPGPQGNEVHAVLITPAPDQAERIVREVNRGLGSHQQIRSHEVWGEADFPRTPILKVDRKLVSESVAGRQPIQLAEARATSADPLVALLTRLAPNGWNGSEDAELEGDLGFDSLGRVELVAAIEEELGRVVDEIGVTAQTTVVELRHLVAQAQTSALARQAAHWPRAKWARIIGRALMWIVFRLQDRWIELEVVHPERAAHIPIPSILIFNYQGPYAPFLMLRALPRALRERIAIAVDARLWQGDERWQGLLAALAVQGFPFVKSGGAVGPSLTELGSWLDDGYGVILSPEGNPERDGELLPFLGGTGLMAVEMNVPVIPFRLENYHLLFAPDPQFPYLPQRRGKVRLIIGEPVIFPSGVSHDQATALARRALQDAY